MNKRPDLEVSDTEQIAERFRLMRREDMAATPPLPSREQLQQRVPVAATSALTGFAWKAMAAASVVAATALLLHNPAPQDPGALYADIMGANSMTTDSLLSVYPSVLPETVGLPDVFTIGGSPAVSPNTN